MVTLRLAQDPDADAFLAQDPLGVLTAMLLDEQIPMEKAFSGPYVLAARLGVDKLDAEQIGRVRPREVRGRVLQVPAIHRFPKAMAERTQKLARAVAEEYDGDAWRRTGARTAPTC